VRLVSTGLAPTADAPKSSRRKSETPPCYVSCEACGVLVLTGATTAGARLSLDTHIATYAVQWDQEAHEPILHQSRGYPVHQCLHKETI
jgi:hypothetical protein